MKQIQLEKKIKKIIKSIENVEKTIIEQGDGYFISGKNDNQGICIPHR